MSNRSTPRSPIFIASTLLLQIADQLEQGPEVVPPKALKKRRGSSNIVHYTEAERTRIRQWYWIAEACVILIFGKATPLQRRGQAIRRRQCLHLHCPARIDPITSGEHMPSDPYASVPATAAKVFADLNSWKAELSSRFISPLGMLSRDLFKDSLRFPMPSTQSQPAPVTPRPKPVDMSWLHEATLQQQPEVKAGAIKPKARKRRRNHRFN